MLRWGDNGVLAGLDRECPVLLELGLLVVLELGLELGLEQGLLVLCRVLVLLATLHHLWRWLGGHVRAGAGALHVASALGASKVDAHSAAVEGLPVPENKRLHCSVHRFERNQGHLSQLALTPAPQTIRLLVTHKSVRATHAMNRISVMGNWPCPNSSRTCSSPIVSGRLVTCSTLFGGTIFW